VYEVEAINSDDTVGALADSAQADASDIVVFGRHKILQLNPFKIGRVPLRSLITKTQAILIMPSVLHSS